MSARVRNLLLWEDRIPIQNTGGGEVAPQSHPSVSSKFLKSFQIAVLRLDVFEFKTGIMSNDQLAN